MAIKDLFGKELKVINIGSPSFVEDLKLQNRQIRVQHFKIQNFVLRKAKSIIKLFVSHTQNYLSKSSVQFNL